jgi:diaminohydroxyphosphoribosylaminopyrimidine deaminase/5-amino-6-(5-phosphoribosylamino)uracil reductase
MTGAPARAEVHRMRANADAIGIGVGTAIADDPLLTVRHWSRPRVNPVRVVFDSGARLPLASHLVQTAQAQPVLVLGQRPDPAAAAALIAAGVDVVTAASLADALQVLHGRGVRHLLVEGGALLGSALVRESLADRVIIFHTPAHLGPGAVPAFTAGAGDPLSAPERWTQVVRRPIGDDTLAIWAPRR